MRLITSLLLITAIATAGIFSYFQLNKIISPCDETTIYRIDTIDPQFNISESEFKSAALVAAQLWNGATGKQLLNFGQQGELSINLIFDERQAQLYAIHNLKSTVSTTEVSIDLQSGNFDQEVADFKRRLNEFNEKVKDWNQQGGAPPEIFNQLKAEQQALDQEAKLLNEKAAQLNRSVELHNTKVSELNEAVSTFNEILENKPEGGIFQGEQNRIEIYVNDDRSDLIRILAHEMGHAIGIDHVASPASIMYPESNDQSALSPEDIFALKEVCKGEKVIDLILQKVKYLQFELKTSKTSLTQKLLV